MPSSVTLECVRKVAGDKVILNNVSLEVRSGEFLTLVGPSGCGKSTLLRLIAGLTDHASGHVRIDGCDVTALAPRERGVAMVFQSYALYPHMTVRENIATPLRMSELGPLGRMPIVGRFFERSTKDSIRRRVEEAARSVELLRELDRKPSQLSGGQRQRVAIARALVRNPGVFLMDEPLSNLDARLRVHMRGEISKLHKTLGSTIIYVTHDQTEAMTLSDRVALMMDGEIIQLGTPRELFERPDDIRVARFIGSPEINLIEGSLCDGELRLCGKLLGISLSGAVPERVVLGIRPQHWRGVVNDDCHVSFSFRVEREESLGADMLLYGRLAGEAEGLSERVARLPFELAQDLKRASREWAAPVTLWIDPKRILVFDASTGRRISHTGKALLESTDELERAA